MTSPDRAAYTLSGRVCLVTGAGAGIGAATARFLHRQGAFVIVNDIVPDAAAAMAGELGQRSLALPGDVSDPALCADLVATATAEAGPIDILVNNAAAGTPIADFVDIDPASWVPALSSLWATLACTHAVLPSMQQRRYGRIVNITSISGVHGVVGMSLYSAGKSAIHAFTSALAKETAAFGVTVNCVAPGTVDTARQRARDPELRAARAAQIPLGRFASPDEVAATVGFFASDESAYVTGEVLLVDGGRP